MRDPGRSATLALLASAAIAACTNNGSARSNDAGSDSGVPGSPDGGVTCEGRWKPIAGPYSACVYAGRCAACWGSAYHFDGTYLGLGTSVVLAQLPSDIRNLVVGMYYTCALLAEGTVLCHGGNGKGELGNGRGGDGHYATVETNSVDLGGVPVQALAGGEAHLCAVRVDGTVWCWGDNSWGQLGIGESGLGNNRTTPVKVDLGGGTVRSLVASGVETCVVLMNGEVVCWGDSHNLISGRVPPFVTPTSVPLNGAVAELALGGNYCVRLESGPIECWGGQESTAPPAPVPGLDPSHVVWFGVGGSNGLALLDSGTLVGWGYNSSGELGQIDLGPYPNATPINVGGPVAAGAAGGFAYNCAVLVTGAVKCWGNNSRSQLGIQSGTVTTFGRTPAELPDVISE